MEALREEIYDHTSDPAQESFRNQQYQRSSMQRSAIVDRLRREGCRITKQRKIILDIILQEECTCCKEIYFLASKKDPNIGMATVYRQGEYDAYPLKIATNGRPEENTQKTEVNYSVFG